MFAALQGAGHSNLWDPTTSDPIGAGSMLVYYDEYSAMGVGDNTLNRHLNAHTKRTWNWIPAAQMPIITASGEFDIIAHDFQDSLTQAGANGLLGACFSIL